MNTETIKGIETAMAASDAPQPVADENNAAFVAPPADDVVDNAPADGESQESDGDSANPDGEDAPARSNKGVGKRINELTRKQKEAERRAEEAERLLEEYRQRSEAPKPVQQSQEGKPTREQFDWDEDAYVNAVVQWNIDQRELKTAQQKAQAESQKRVQTLKEAEDAFADEHPDYMDKISNLLVTEHMRAALMEADMAPNVAYHLANNPEIAEQIRNKSPMAQVVAIGQLAAKFASAPDSPPARPAPPVQVPPPPPAPTLSARAPAAAPVEKWDMNQHLEAIRAKNRR